MATQTLDGLRIVVTGGLGALGRSTGRVLSQRGARVTLLDRAQASTIPEVTAVIGDVDLTDPDSTRAAFDAAASGMGGIDGLVNIAGGFSFEKVEGGAAQTWDRLYAMNLRTAVLASQAALPWLLQSPAGSIVNIGAMAALKAGAGMGAYAASKAGVMRLTESMAEEFKQRGLRVNAVLPSTLDTPANRADMPDADFARWVTPDSLAQVIAFLLSREARDVTGACLPVTGRV